MGAPARLERFVWDGPYAGTFEPEGVVASHGTDRTRPGPVLAARVVISFPATNASASALDELIQVAREVRGRQCPADRDPLVLAQAGFYRHRDASGAYHADAGGQVVVVDSTGTARKQFEAEMIELAETIARWFEQRIVVLDLQVDAVTQVVHAVSP